MLLTMILLTVILIGAATLAAIYAARRPVPAVRLCATAAVAGAAVAGMVGTTGHAPRDAAPAPAPYACAAEASGMMDAAAETYYADSVPAVPYAAIVDACAHAGQLRGDPDATGWVTVVTGPAGVRAVVVQGYGELFYLGSSGYASTTDNFGTVVHATGWRTPIY